MADLVDHLWQSLQVIGCLAVFAWLTRHHSARFRVWLWRAAALKLLVPLQALVALGAWVGFPVSHSADPPPAALVAYLTDLASWVAPARHLEVGPRGFLLAALLLVSVATGWCVGRRIRVEVARAAAELRRLEHDPDDHPPGIGLITAAAMTAWALLLVVIPTLSGAIDERLRRQELLRQNGAALRHATVVLRPARGGMGQRYRVVADPHGVTIRNATLREMGGLAYGVSVYLVRGQHFVKEGEQDWLSGPRYDVRITGPVIAPEEFDTYALRAPLTQALATQFGLEIYDNGVCAPPCGRWGSYVLPATAREALD